MGDTQQYDARGDIKIARQSSSMGLIMRQKEPYNLESPFLPVDSFLTPTEMFYIRSHFVAPKLNLANYQLRIDGAVRNPLSLSYRQLREMPSETRVAILECAGHSRVFLVPQVDGAQWELGAVGNAEWTGIPSIGEARRDGNVQSSWYLSAATGHALHGFSESSAAQYTQCCGVAFLRIGRSPQRSPSFDLGQESRFGWGHRWICGPCGLAETGYGVRRSLLWNTTRFVATIRFSTRVRHSTAASDYANPGEELPDTPLT